MALESDVGRLLINLVDILKSNVVNDVMEFIALNDDKFKLNSNDLRALTIKLSQSIDVNAQNPVNEILKTVRLK